MGQKNKLNFAFFGTPDIAADTLEILKQNGLIPSLVVTAPDKPVGRKMVLTPPPTKVWALNQSKHGSGQAQQNNIPVLQPEKLDSVFKSQITNYKPDIFIVVAYGKIFPEWLINLPEYGTLNIHYSLLPKYRGAAPVQAAILAGDEETGVTIQKMVLELDAGPIVAQERVKIGPNEKTPELMERLVKVGAELLVRTLPDYISGTIKPVEQDHSKATKVPKIKKEDGLINLDDDPELNWRKYRAYDPWPGIYFFVEKNKKRIRVKITDAEYEKEKFIIKKVIPEGRKEIDYEDFK